MRDFLVAHEPKSDIVDLDESIEQLTNGAARQEAIMKDASVQLMNIN